jgi:isopropylmalate/homocitrate/citramalate synthase
MGIHTFDASIAGLGGCPYAKGATGNVGTEDVLFMLRGLDIETGIDLDRFGRCCRLHLGGNRTQARVARPAARCSRSAPPRQRKRRQR